MFSEIVSISFTESFTLQEKIKNSSKIVAQLALVSQLKVLKNVSQIQFVDVQFYLNLVENLAF